MVENILDVQNLYVEYKNMHQGKVSKIHAVNGVDLKLNKGEILAVAGESGCGKSTLAKAIIKLVPYNSGKIFFLGKDISSQKFVKEIQMIFQNPYASLNPKMKILDILKEPLKINTDFSDSQITSKVFEIAQKVGIDEKSLSLYPHEFSGGQRQRIAIARALILNPALVLADEPVSALDVSIQAQIINLLKDLKDSLNLTILFISHDLSVIKYLADRVAIMYLGEIVEAGLTDEIFYNHKHPYTKALLSAVPKINDIDKQRIILSGDLPSAENLPSGCKFYSRCPYCMSKCRESVPNNVRISDTHFVKCFLSVI